MQDAINSCPVDCIHWVDKDQLPALEYVMQRRTERTNVGVMMAGQGGATADVFALTTRFLKERDQRCVSQIPSGIFSRARKVPDTCQYSSNMP